MTAPQIKIASYNLQKCVGLDLRRRPDRSLQVIDALDADVVVLQEADKRLPPRPAALPHEMIEHSGWRIVPFGAPGGSLGWHGNAMLVRRHITILQTAHVELPGLEPRGAIRADLGTAIGPLRVIGLHLGLIRRYRLLQIASISRALRDLPEMATLWAGDFNDWGNGRALDTAAQGVVFLPPSPSFPAPRPVAALDRFAACPRLVANDQGTYAARPARVASDHLPIWVNLSRND